MDIEKAIEHLLQTAARHDEQIAALLRVAELHNQKIGELDEVMKTLAEAQIRNQEEFRKTDELFRETDRRFRDTDKRVQDLVIAMGKFIARGNGKKD